ncbi:uncharacterized protein LOC143168488 [Aptenodytes patagonicus]|uniref:uncharacterized protein LOC143168488 n=1 Tax=Aptenodytes patagonicus TaxID=9234 RepID=UPI003FA00718
MIWQLVIAFPTTVLSFGTTGGLPFMQLLPARQRIWGSEKVEDNQVTVVTEEEGRRGGEKRLNWQILLAVLRARAVVEDSQATGVTEEEGMRAGERSI